MSRWFDSHTNDLVAIVRVVHETVCRREAADVEAGPTSRSCLPKLYRDQYNPDLSLPDSVVEDLLAVGTFRLKEKPKAALNLQSVRDWSFAEKAKR
jgi:hypothetical protein